MPIICKISLDASEYQAQLQKVIAETQALDSTLGEKNIKVTADTAEAKAALSDLSDQSDLSDKSFTVAADTAEAKAALSDLSDQSDLSDKEVVVTADVSPAKKEISKVKKEASDIKVKGDASSLKQSLSAVRAELNKTQGGAGKFLETFLAGGGGIGIIMAGVASLGKIVATVYNNWRQRLQENAELHSNNAASIREAAEANEQVRQKTDGCLGRLQELAKQENLSNANKVEAKKLIDDLSSSYDNLGVKLDKVTGKLIGVDEATVKKLQVDKARRISEIDSEMKQLQSEKKQQAEIRDTAGVAIWFDGNTRIGGEEETKAAAKKIEELNKRIMELNKKRSEIKRSDPFEEFRKKQKPQVEDLKKQLADQRKITSESSDMSDLSDPSEKISHLQKQRDRHKKEMLDPLQRKINAAESRFIYASGDRRVEAEKHLLQLKIAQQQELQKSYALEKQISDVKKQQEQQQEQQQKQFNKSIHDQAFNLRGQIMNQTGFGKEFAQSAALKQARETKGSDLTENEKRSVLQLSEISWNLSNRRETSLGDLSIKTNALTSRGGFRGGAAVNSPDRYNREIAQTSKTLLSTLQRIETLCKDMGTF